jgi:hypothetical protein
MLDIVLAISKAILQPWIEPEDEWWGQPAELNSDWWLPGTEPKAPKAVRKLETPPREYSSIDAWMEKYENGMIPKEALAKVPGTNFLMQPGAAYALGAMIQAAKADGITLKIGNTYRDRATQAQLYQAYLSGSRSAPVAPPGRSQHGWGLAVDFSAIDERAFEWLVRNAHRFGFSNPWLDNENGKSYYGNTEPWHWEWKGGVQTETIPPQKPRRRVPRVPQPQRSPFSYLWNTSDVFANAVAMVVAEPIVQAAKPAKAKTKAPAITAEKGTPEYWRQVAHRIAVNEYGYSEEDWRKLDYIIQRESRWNPNAVNQSSGAFGIPQIMPKAHPDALKLKDDPLGQIYWLFRYIENRYGGIDNAYRFKIANGWY